MAKRSLLIVEDDPTLLSFLSQLCAEMNFSITKVDRGDDAIKQLNTKSFDIVLSDINLPDVSGIEILKTALEVNPSTQVILITAYASVNLAVDAMKVGACDFLQKPFTADALEASLTRAEEKISLKHQITVLNRAIPDPSFIGLNGGLKDVSLIIDKVAASNANVVIYGESGSGKELVAREIHRRSARTATRMVTLHIAAIPDTLIESELFGHEKGAFTGADVRRVGLLELADGGTLFLDEIGDLSEMVQVKILRFIQERSFRRLGGNDEIEVDVRVLAATHRDLAKRVKEGLFREDLFYRLNVVPIDVPPLRERKEDIPSLVDYFVQRCALDMKSEVKKVSSHVVDSYVKYDWPGNVRELENVVSRAVALTQGNELNRSYVETGEKGVASDVQEEAYSLPEHLESIERQAIIKALELDDGVKARAAKRLGIKRTTLIEKMGRFGIK